MSLLLTDQAREQAAETARLIRIVNAHLSRGGYCPVCVWDSGNRVTDPCDILLELRLKIRESLAP